MCVVCVHPCQAVNLQQTRKFAVNQENTMIKLLCLYFLTSSVFQRSLSFFFYLCLSIMVPIFISNLQIGYSTLTALFRQYTNMHRKINKNTIIMIKATHLVRLPLKTFWKTFFSTILWKTGNIRGTIFFALWSCTAITVSHGCEDGTFEMFSSLLKAAETARGQLLRLCKHAHAFRTEKVHLHSTSYPRWSHTNRTEPLW